VGSATARLRESVDGRPYSLAFAFLDASRQVGIRTAAVAVTMLPIVNGFSSGCMTMVQMPG
jgi:hypothetical protein